jgi:hypothetical protein
VCVTCTGRTKLNPQANTCDPCTPPSATQKWAQPSGCDLVACPPNSTADPSHQTCTCNSGYILGPTGCVLKPTTCPMGYTLPTQGFACEPCPADTYKDNTSIGACTQCQNGMYHSPVASTSASACQISTTCGPGLQLNIDVINQTAGCSACPVDTFKNSTGQGMCTPCPAGQTTYGQIGQTSCQTKSTWFQGTSCVSNYGFNVNNYRSKTEYCNDYTGDGRGNNDPCCRPQPPPIVYVPPPPPPPPPPPAASPCDCDDRSTWVNSQCGRYSDNC